MLKPGFLDSFPAGILASLNSTKSGHDFIFRPWGETLGYVQTSPTKKSRLNHV